MSRFAGIAVAAVLLAGVLAVGPARAAEPAGAWGPSRPTSGTSAVSSPAGAAAPGGSCKTAPDAAGPPPRAEPPAGFTGSAAYRALRRSGREVVAEREVDLDGDGRADTLVVARRPAGLDLAAYRRQGPGRYGLLTRSAPLAGDQLARLEPLALGRRAGWLLDVVEDSPDEADHRLALFVANPAGLARVFSGRWRQPHSEQQAGRAAEDRLDLGGLALGLELQAAPAGDGWPRLILRDAPEELLFGAAGRPALRVRIGVRERHYVHRGVRYVEHEEVFRSYLQPVAVERVEPLADRGAPAGGGTETGEDGPAGDELAADEPAAEEPAGDEPAAGDEDTAGGAIAQVIDGSPATGWRTTAGSGLELSLAGAARVRALRLVSGCAGAGRVTRFGLQLDGGPRHSVDASAPGRLAAPLAAVGDYRLAGREAAGQTLVFFAAPQALERLELRIEALAPAGGEACLIELTPLAALGDRPKP